MADETYLFDVPNKNGEPKYVIDATDHGNESRFINHSCSPNLDVKTIVGFHDDPALAQIVFFSNTEIKAGDELTISYYPHKINVNMIGEGTPKCQCLSKKCRGYLI